MTWYHMNQTLDSVNKPKFHCKKNDSQNWVLDEWYDKNLKCFTLKNSQASYGAWSTFLEKRKKKVRERGIKNWFLKISQDGFGRIINYLLLDFWWKMSFYIQ